MRGYLSGADARIGAPHLAVRAVRATSAGNNKSIQARDTLASPLASTGRPSVQLNDNDRRPVTSAFF